QRGVERVAQVVRAHLRVDGTVRQRLVEIRGQLRGVREQLAQVVAHTRHSSSVPGKPVRAPPSRGTRNERAYSHTTSRRWLIPRVRTETIPCAGRDAEARAPVTSVSDHSVSPTKTGW